VRLRITEIFFSLQGETTKVGLPTVFIRLTGCPLRCGYCDTTYAFQGGEWHELPEILREVGKYPARHITVTGGEPLAQRDCHRLLSQLCDAGYAVSLETSGALDVSGVDSRVKIILDIKTPGSGESARNLWSNLDHLSAKDEIKFVLTSPEDYLWAGQIMKQHGLPERCEVLLSPAHGALSASDLADWMLRDGLQARLQLQLHKILWGEARGR